jgi:hypothetical protein
MSDMYGQRPRCQLPRTGGDPVSSIFLGSEFPEMVGKGDLMQKRRNVRRLHLEPCEAGRAPTYLSRFPSSDAIIRRVDANGRP